VPAFKVTESKFSIPSDHLHIKISGNFIAQILNFLKDFFMNTIRHKIEDEVQKAINSAVPPILNKQAKDTKGEIEIFNNLMLDWSTPQAPQFTAKDVELSSKGLFFKKGQPEHEPAVPKPNMILHDDAAKSKFQAFISDYLADSLAESFLKVQVVDLWLLSKDVHGFNMTTTGLDPFLPGIEAKYGPNEPVDLEFKLNALENFNVVHDDGTMGFDSTVSVRFMV